MNKEKKIENKYKVIGMICVGIALSVAATTAYFTDSDSLTNTFTAGGVTSELTETQYNAQDPAERDNIGPGKTMIKDPVVTNKDSLDMYTFLKVSVPVKEVKTYDPVSKKVLEAQVMPLFTWETDSQWTLIKTEKLADTWDYYYAFGTAQQMTAIKPNQSTTSLFKHNQITFINVIEGQGLENTRQDVIVTDYSGQTTDLGTNVPKDILEIYMNHR